MRLEQKQARGRQRNASASSPTLLAEIQRLCKVFGLELRGAEEQTAEMVELEESWLTAKVTLLAAAYHNAGVQQEAARQFDLAVQSYVDGSNLARTHLLCAKILLSTKAVAVSPTRVATSLRRCATQNGTLRR